MNIGHISCSSSSFALSGFPHVACIANYDYILQTCWVNVTIATSWNVACIIFKD